MARLLRTIAGKKIVSLQVFTESSIEEAIDWVNSKASWEAVYETHGLGVVLRFRSEHYAPGAWDEVMEGEYLCWDGEAFLS